MSADSLLRLERTTLFELLILKEQQIGGDHEISERVRAIVAHIAPLMERIPDKMPEYTLHDPNHGAKVVELMGLLIPKSTLEILNHIELSILIYAGYLHDLGMTCSTAERELIIKSDADFANLLASDQRHLKQIQAFRAMGDHRSATHVEDQVFTEYLRRFHVKRSATFIEFDLAQGAREIAWKGTPYWRLVQAVCDSHALPVRDLRDTRRWPRDALVRNARVNVQYLALVLRLGDILDLDPERTPKVLLDFIDPTDPTSIIEWNKHRSIIGWEVTPERIQFEAECTDAVYERALREFIGWIEVERSDSVALASSYRDDIARAYHLDLTEPVTAERIRSNGSYIFSTLRFEIDHERVINLLMGERLYRNPAVALRELIQNAFDAVRYRQALEMRDGDEFLPKIAIALDNDQLCVEDNGIGMDAETITKYFMQVGKSYYTSPQFRSQKLDLDIVSEFGIGILSAFMVADRLTVESRRRPEDPLAPPEPVLVEIPTAHRYFVQRPSKRINIGTKVSLSLKEGHPFSGDALQSLVAQMVPFGEYPISIAINGKRFLHSIKNAATDRESRVADRSEFFQFPVDAAADPNLEGVTGVIGIVAEVPSMRHEFLNSSIIAQCGFAVMELHRHDPTRKPAHNLFPEWTQFAADLDIRPPARLALTPDRGSIVDNDESERIRRALDRQAVRAMHRHLSEQILTLSTRDYADYVDQMIEAGALKAETYIGFTLSDEALDLFLDFIPFECIDNDGSLKRVLGRTLAENDIIVLADPRGWPEGTDTKDVRREVDIQFGATCPIIVDHDVGHSNRSPMYDFLFAEIGGHLISSVPGVVLDLVMPRIDAKVDSHVRGIMHFTFNVQSNANGHTPALFHKRDSSSIAFEYPLFNADHPFFSPLRDKLIADELDDSHEQVLITLHERVGALLSDSIAVDHVQTTDGVRSGRSQRGRLFDSILMHAPNRALTGILIRDTGLFPLIQSAFVEYWQAAIVVGAVSKASPIPDFSVADLPWFWALGPQ